MAKFSPTAHMPRYLQAFRCIGPACPQTCCSGWRVTIDKANFKLLQAIETEPLHTRVKIHVVRSDGNNPGDWAHLRMNPDGDCGFLDGDHLCSIQKQLGAGALSQTCNHYPRVHQQIDAEHRVFASLSCPEAARLALTDPQAMLVEPVKLDGFNNAGELPPEVLWNDAAEPPRISHLSGRVLHDLLIELFSAQQYGAFDALALGLMLVRRLNAHQQAIIDRTDSGAPAPPREQVLTELSAIYERFLDKNHNKELLDMVRGLPVGDRFAPDMLGEVTRTVRARRLTPSTRTLLEEVAQGLLLDDPDPQASRARWAEVRSGRWAEWDRTHSHVLKNYAINSLQYGLLARHFGKPKALEAAYLDLVIRAALTRYWLIGQMATHGRSFAEEHAVRTVSALSRNVEHDRNFMTGVLKAMDEQGIRSLATGVVLLH